MVQPDLVEQVENDLQNIMAGGSARDVDILLRSTSCLVFKSSVGFVSLEYCCNGWEAP